MYWKTTKAMMLTIVLTMLAACAGTGGREFGDSVREMTEKQIHNLDAAYNPDPAPVTGGDVYKLDDILDAHRNNAEDPTEDRGVLTEGY